MEKNVEPGPSEVPGPDHETYRKTTRKSYLYRRSFPRGIPTGSYRVRTTDTGQESAILDLHQMNQTCSNL